MSARRLVALVLAGVLVAGLAAVLVVRSQARTPVEASLAIVDDDERFATAIEASDAFAEISVLLAEADCDADRENDGTCDRTMRAAAWSQVTAVLIARCTPPAVFEARAGLGRYLRGGQELPAAPRCAERRQTSS